MNRGLISKTMREVWLATALFAAGVGIAEGAISRILPTFYNAIPNQWLEIPFMQNIFKALTGTDMIDSLGPNAITAIAWAHPVVLALVMAHGIMFCTRVPAGEVDRGTADVLLGLPVSRAQIYLNESIVWLITGGIVIAVGLLGNLIGGASARAEVGTPLWELLIITVNLFCLYAAVGGIAWLASSLTSRRGQAIGVVCGVVFVSFLVNFLAPFSETVNRFAFLGVLDYYRPLEVLRDAAWPVQDMLILGGIGGITWLIGAIVFARRDICTI